MKPQQKTLTLWIVVILMMALVAKVLQEQNRDQHRFSYSEFIKSVEEGHVAEVNLNKTEDIITGKFKDNFQNGRHLNLL